MVELKQLNALKGCVKSLYGVNLKTFVPVAPNSNGYFFGLNANGNPVTVETDVTHSSWNLAVTILPPTYPPPAGRTPLGTNPSQMNYVASYQLLMSAGLIQPTQIHELGHSLDQITSGSIFKSSEASADRLLNCVNSNTQ
jgi:hypothetical protein